MSVSTDLYVAPFADGLEQWSRQDGRPGSSTYADGDGAAYVPGDADFGGCLEIVKTQPTQKVRFMGQTPMRLERYIRVVARVKLITGNMPNVAIAAYAGDADGNAVSAVTSIGPATTLDRYGKVFEISAIIGPGARSGVDMVWGAVPVFGHFGVDFQGSVGGVIRMDDLEIHDVTDAFVRDMIPFVDVRDFGALGNGTTDDRLAFVAADGAAQGRTILIPEGDFYVGSGLSLASRVDFQGRIVMPDDAPLVLSNSYRMTTYIDAFKDEELAFQKAFQALLNSGDHDSLDLGGRTISLTKPVDMQKAVATKDTYAIRRVIRNGQFYAASDGDWDKDVVFATAKYSPNASRKLTNVANINAIQDGSLVGGAGVGREVYVTRRNISAQEVELSEPLFDADGTQEFTFTRFKYMLDFSGFEKLSKFSLQNVELHCNGVASGVSLAKEGITFNMRDCFITRPKHRGITSTGTGCQGMLIDRCHFVTDEGQTAAQDRESIVLNASGNDVKLRENWASQFRHFAVLSGSNNIISGNHFYQGDGRADGIRVAGIALTRSNTASTVVGNYIDNCFVEWTNEHDVNPDFTGGFGFSALSISDNVFLSGDVAPWFAYIVVKPFGTGHGVSNLTVNGNNFRSINGQIDRVERVDTTFADLDRDRFRDIQFMGNNYNNVSIKTENPLRVTHSQNSVSRTWTVNSNEALPFLGRVRDAQSIIAKGAIRNSANSIMADFPYVEVEAGSTRRAAQVKWPTSVKGKIGITLRCDT